MNDIQSALNSLLPFSKKQTPSGWISFDAVCCHHNGEKKDNRKRGGVLTTPVGGFTYHCFNCNFKAGWAPGKSLSANTKKLFKWLGMSETDIGKLNLLSLKLKEDNQPVSKKLALSFELAEKSLPDDSLPINQHIAQGNNDPALLSAISYIVDERKIGWDWYNWHWSPAPGYKDRVIIPYYQNGKIVGYTGRKIKPGNPKYLTERQPGYVFNIDSQKNDRGFVIVVEGEFDAIAIDGVAVMHNEPNEVQCARINALNREVIVIPDRDRAGAMLLNFAIANNWYASLPPWGDDIKDVADAVKKYGRLYVLSAILKYKIHGEIKINLLKKKLESINNE